MPGILKIGRISDMSMGVRRNFPLGGKVEILLRPILSPCWPCNENWRTRSVSPFLHHKENAWSYSNSCKQGFPSKKILHWANSCFSVH